MKKQILLALTFLTVGALKADSSFGSGFAGGFMGGTMSGIMTNAAAHSHSHDGGVSYRKYDRCRDENSDLKQENKDLRNENRDLKKQLRRCSCGSQN